MTKTLKLNKAKIKKDDEFYTQLKDVENELKHYVNYFRDKVIYCNCDDYRWSNIYKHLRDNFSNYGLKKLIATHYLEQDIFGESESPKCTMVELVNGEIKETITDLKGDGDFRSEECVDILKSSDIVITNPPFSLFRDFISVLVDHKKKFIVIGNYISIGCNSIFPYIKSREIIFGVGKSVMWFETSNGLKSIHAVWFTNLDHGVTPEPLVLTEKYIPENYPFYDNYLDAIEVPKTKLIPTDYSGIMGVPITFLEKWNPDQFEVKFGAFGRKCPHLRGKRLYNRVFVRNKTL